MTHDFTGKTVLVTGASRGIGSEIVRQFAKCGATTAIHYHKNEKAALDVLDRLPGQGHVIARADLTDPDQIRRLVDDAVRKLGKIDILVNNAGIFEYHAPAKTSFDDWRHSWENTLAANLLGPAHLTHLTARHMMDRKQSGKIINISSRGAFRGEPDAPAYGASKAGLNAFSQSMAQALAPYGIFVYAVAPGFVETDMAAVVLDGPHGDEVRAQSPLNRVARPEEVAATVLFLAGPGVDFLTGGIIDVNGASYLRT